MRETIVVTGGAGFIGSHLVDALVGHGHEVRVIDVLHPLAHTKRPEYINPGATYIWSDLRDSEALGVTLRGATAICHQASMVGLGVNMNDITEYVAHNDQATAALLRGLFETKFVGPIVLGSSMVVYGEGAYRCEIHGRVRPGPRPQSRLALGKFEPTCPDCDSDLVPESVTEDAPTDPRNVYAATKLHQEHLCASYARESGSTLSVLRYHNVYGPRMPRDTPYAGVASIFRSALEAGRPPEVFEDGGQIRDFVHVTDVARANIAALSGINGTFNVCSGTPRTIGDMATALHGEISDGAIPGPRITGAFRLGDVRHVFASAEHARKELNFDAVVTFEDGMKDFATAALR